MISKKLLEEEYINKNRTMVDLANELGVSRSTLWYYAKKYDLIGNRVKRNITRGINDSLISLDNENIYYIAGLVATDGFIRGNNITLALSENGMNLLNKIALKLEYEGDVKVRENHGGYSDKPFYELTLYSDKFVEILKSYFNIKARKKDNLARFPEDLINSSNIKQLMYIRGILDGDGTFDPERGRYQICMGNEVFLSNITDFLNTKFGFDIDIKYRYDRDVHYPYILIPRIYSEKIINWIYSDNIDVDDLYLEYKYEIYRKYMNK